MALMLCALGAICGLMAESRVAAGVDLERSCAERKAKVMDHERQAKGLLNSSRLSGEGMLVDDKYPRARHYFRVISE
jgi:hypothetical protein